MSRLLCCNCKSEDRSCLSLLCSKSEKNPNPYLDLVWTKNLKGGRPGLNTLQKTFLEMALLGGVKSLEEGVAFLKKDKKMLISKVVRPLEEMGLLKLGEEGGVDLTEDFEEVLHKVCIASGGEEARKRAREQFLKDRND